jgi:hypothetical protein
MSELVLSIGLLVVELLLILALRRYQRRPVDMRKPRLVPSSLVTLAMMTLVIVSLATAAHIVSLLTGVQLKPRRKMGT